MKTKHCKECKTVVPGDDDSVVHCCVCQNGITRQDWDAKQYKKRASGDGLFTTYYHASCWDLRPTYRRKRCSECGEIMDHDDPNLSRVVDCDTGKLMTRTWAHLDCLPPGCPGDMSRGES